jgi:hypothetical protein
MAIDSTGLKRFGRDEWHQEKHKVSAKRSWRKLHVCVDDKHYIHGSVLTDRFASDEGTVDDLIEQVTTSANHVSLDGETEDYKVNIGVYTNLGAKLVSQAELVVTPAGDNHFDITLKSDKLNETMIISLHDVFGQKLVENRIEKVNGQYTYPLDLSYAKAGVYIVRVGTHQYGKVKKIFVK